jgi:hypothetical protein
VTELVEFYVEESQIVLPRLLARAGSSISHSSTATIGSKASSSI